MALWWISILGWAHPATESSSAADPLVRASDEAVAGPLGCFETAVVLTWDHRSGSFRTTGGASTEWRFDDRIWRLDRYDPQAAHPNASDVRVAPQLLGRSVATDLRYPTTPHRVVAWPAPVSTLPTRLAGQVETTSVDRLEDGTVRVVEGFAWDGWKEVTGERTVTFDPSGAASEVRLDTTDHWRNGCTVRSVGSATVDPGGLPRIETWTFTGRCPLRDWTAQWSFAYGPWTPCSDRPIDPSGEDAPPTDGIGSEIADRPLLIP